MGTLPPSEPLLPPQGAGGSGLGGRSRGVEVASRYRACDWPGMATYLGVAELVCLVCGRDIVKR